MRRSLGPDLLDRGARSKTVAGTPTRPRATAAAAILSVYGADRVGPGAVAVKDVKTTKNGKGWSCQVQKFNAFQGMVTFNVDGKCTSVSKVYAGPLPP